MGVKLKNIAIVILTGLFLFGFAAWNLLKPADTESVSERRLLAAFPDAGKDAVLSGRFMTDFEKYALDQFPMRGRFRTLKAITSYYILGQRDNHGIYIKDGYASKLEYPMNRESLQYAAARFRFIYDRYLAEKDINVYVSVIPDKNYFLAGRNGYPSIDYDTFIAKMRENMDFAAYIDIVPLLELSDYYFTDTHWRQERIVDVARCLAGEMGIALSNEYTKTPVNVPFYGVYYGQSALSLSADKLYYLDHAFLSNCSVYDYETDTSGPVYDLERTKGNDPYEMFLSGPKALLILENPDADTDKELILFRDSFGSCLAPLLAEGYAKITLVDIRYLSPDLLGRFISFENQDVLFLYSTTVLNNSNTIK